MLRASRCSCGDSATGTKMELRHLNWEGYSLLEVCIVVRILTPVVFISFVVMATVGWCSCSDYATGINNVHNMASEIREPQYFLTSLSVQCDCHKLKS